jgi:hypothetical protein
MNILISGGSGNVGKVLIPLLEKAGHTCYTLTRRPKMENDLYWNPSQGKGELPKDLIIDAVVHLAGYSVSNRWTESNKKEMIDSRLESTALLKKMLIEKNPERLIWIQASAIGIYQNLLDWQDESSAHGHGFLADLTASWEKTIADHPHQWRVATLRIGVVMDKKSGALAAMLPAFRWGLGSALGSGKQWMSWIAIEDLARMILFAVEQPNIQGVYNAVAPHPIDNKSFSQTLCHALRRPFWLPNVPPFVLRLMFGEMSSMVLNSQRISAQKIQSTGFEFQYNKLSEYFQKIFS